MANLVDWRTRYAAKCTTPAEAMARIPKGKTLFIGSGAAEPHVLVRELVAQAHQFADNPIVHLLTLGPAPYVDEQYQGAFRHNAFFIGPNVRDAVHQGRADYTPVFLSQIPALIRSGRMPVDVALIEVSPPDEFGFVNLGASVDIIPSAIDAARLVIAEINPNMPVVYGGGFVPMEKIHAWVLGDEPLPELPREPLDDVALEIGRNVASLVEDTATLQVGIGQIPDAVLRALDHHKDLGVWSEMFSDGVVDLIENGNITGKHKAIHPNKVSAGFSFGTKRVYDFINRNPIFTFQSSELINDPVMISRQHRMVAINSALQIDLTGQVCADSIGTRFYSGIGGQVDFIRGAAMCPNGKPVIAIRSTAKGGELSRIVPVLDEGAGVVTSRGDVRYVVTEYGIADLQGKSIRERALALIGISHPDFRSDLLAAAKQRRCVFADQLAPRVPYPRRLERVVETTNGRLVRVRPMQIADEPKVTALFYSLSKTTVYRRWMSFLKQIPESERVRGFELDYTKNMALLVETVETAKESEIVATARYHTDPATNFADVAFVVRDDWQRLGLGTLMMAAMLPVAREAGLAGFTADVLHDNLAMLSVFHKSGLDIHSSLDEGVFHLKMEFRRRGRRETDS
jgi:acyl-CoA hydrolase/GNAT superfamily N-acetyltransferase